MIKRIDIGSSAFRFHTWPDQTWYLPSNDLFAKTRRFQDQLSAEVFLEQISETPGGIDALNTLVASSVQFLRPLRRRDKREIIEDAAKCILSGDIQVVDLGWQPPKPCWIPPDTKATPEVKEDSTAAPKPTSLAVKIVWADNGEPVSGIAMSVQTPEGNSFSRTTNSEGKVAVDTAEEGLCALNCSFSGVSMSECVIFAGEGDVPESERTEAATEPKPESVLSIVNVTAHRVRTGDSLNDLARSVGLTWKELASFNWGTESPDEINKHLIKDVGCTRRTKDGNNLLFDDSDEPGIVYLPRAWSLRNLATGGNYTIRVKAPWVETARAWIKLKLLDDETGAPLSGIKLLAKLADGTEFLALAGASGVATLTGIPAGACEVRSEIEGFTLDRSFVFVGTGSQTAGGAGDPGIKGKTEKRDAATGREEATIVVLEKVKVKDGDTLESLAKRVGLTWEQLAYFNWGTMDLAKVNRYLQHEVGCTRRTEDQTTFVLESSNKPGVVYLPKPWAQSSLAVNQEHVLRVQRPPLDLRFLYQLDVDNPDAKNDELILETVDGRWRHTLQVKDLQEVEENWVELVFPRPPRGKALNLIQDPKDGKAAFYVFEGLTVEEILGFNPESL